MSPQNALVSFTPLSGITGSGVEAHQATTLGAGVFELYVPPGATCVMIQACAQNIRYTLTGSNPTTTFGFQLVAAAQPIVINLNNKTFLKFIRETAGAVLQITFGVG